MARINLSNCLFFLATGFGSIRLEDTSEDFWIRLLFFIFFLEFSSHHKLIVFLICFWNCSFSFLIRDQLGLLLRRVIWLCWRISYRVFCKEFNFALRIWRSYGLWLPVWYKFVLISNAWLQVTRIEHLFESKVNWVVVEQTTLSFVFITSPVSYAEKDTQFKSKDCHVKQECEKNCLHWLFHLLLCL